MDQTFDARAPASIRAPRALASDNGGMSTGGPRESTADPQRCAPYVPQGRAVRVT